MALDEDPIDSSLRKEAEEIKKDLVDKPRSLLELCEIQKNKALERVESAKNQFEREEALEALDIAEEEFRYATITSSKQPSSVLLDSGNDLSSLDDKLKDFDQRNQNYFEKGKKLSQKTAYKIARENNETTVLEDIKYDIKTVWRDNITPTLDKMSKPIKSQANYLYKKLCKSLDSKKGQNINTAIYVEKDIDDRQDFKDVSTKNKHPVIKKVEGFCKKVERLSQEFSDKGSKYSRLLAKEIIKKAAINLGYEVKSAAIRGQKEQRRSPRGSARGP